ncbi:MAG TPA: hypothetical protein VFZ66_02610 [Herpetosiphonaceae bacterium]
MGVFVSEGVPRLLQAIVTFEGRGLRVPQALDLRYTVPTGKTSGMFYFRGGSTVSGMVNVAVLRDGQPMRYFPIAADSTVHVSLAIVEDLPAGTRIEICAAGEGSGLLILDIGFLEV